MSTKKEFRQFQDRLNQVSPEERRAMAAAWLRKESMESAEKLLRETGKTEAEIAAWRERAYGPEAVGERVPVEPIDLDAV